jgi:hypothetical protein
VEIDVERKFRLSGEPFDLEALIELFPEIVLKKETVHYLQLSSCDEMPDQEALQHASDELARMNGIVALDHGNHRRIKIDGITHIDPETGEFTTIDHEPTALADGDDCRLSLLTRFRYRGPVLPELKSSRLLEQKRTHKELASPPGRGYVSIVGESSLVLWSMSSASMVISAELSQLPKAH